MQRFVLLLLAAALPAAAQAAPSSPDILSLAARGTSAQVRQALQAGSDPETRGDHSVTPLMYAAKAHAGDAVV
jgi:hypothetical protein